MSQAMSVEFNDDDIFQVSRVESRRISAVEDFVTENFVSTEKERKTPLLSIGYLTGV